MHNDKPFHADLIRHLGGKVQLAKALGISPIVVSKWHVRGIPSGYWHKVIEMPAAIERNVSAEDLRQTKPRTGSGIRS